MLLGWPSVLLAFSISIYGIIHRNPKVQIAPTLLVLPISFYLFGTPRVGWFALTIPLLFVAIAIALKWNHHLLAWLFLVPIAGFFSWLAFIVLTQ